MKTIYFSLSRWGRLLILAALSCPGPDHEAYPMSEMAIFADFPPAILASANGAVFTDYLIGYADETIAEVVFNTAMSGYQEILMLKRANPSKSGLKV